MKVIEDKVSRLGLRTIHYISQRPIDETLRAAPEGWVLVNYMEYEEELIGVHHLWLFIRRNDENG